MKLMQEMWFVDEMLLWDQFTLQIHRSFRVFLIVSDFCRSFPNLVNHRSAYLWPTSFERWGDVVWKSWLFPCVQCSFQMRRWVPMKLLQWSCVKLKLHTRLTPCVTYKKPWPWQPCVCLELLSLRQVWINICKHTLEFDSTVAVRLSRDCCRPRCHK